MKILLIGIDGAEASSLFGDERLVNLRRLMEFGCFGLLESEPSVNEANAWAYLLTSQPAEATRLEEAAYSGYQAYQERALWSQVEAQGGKVDILWEGQQAGEQKLEEAYLASQARFEQAQQKLQAEDWDYLQLVDVGLKQLRARASAGPDQEQVINDYILYLDEQIGALLELLSDEALVLVISPYGRDGLGCFVLASSNNPLTGEVEDVSLPEIAPTLLELGGYPIPETMQGISLVAGKAMERLASEDLSEEEERLLHERLSGLGYLG